MRHLIKQEGAEVIVHGTEWVFANELALKMAKEDGCAFIHPFDDPSIWDGHSTLIRELSQDMKQKPGAIICVVGGGGLLIGILQGLHAVGWEDVPIIAVETQGAHSLNNAILQGEWIELHGGITSIAKSLGARKVAEEAFAWTKKHKIISVVVSDKEALDACSKFAEHQKVLVEPACGAGLAILYNPEHYNKYCKQLNLNNIVAVVCGGSVVTLEYLDTWKKQLELIN
eukprot:TRINITY_DN7398_c0_g1_i1.p1 TRINITY_DN7398_c0_g1~~TRINITY_DN7398_c0_g1_i1.p1  ORF type:complete len:228 (-),score=45.03 TRINITY_DN7398_c0_g1_i1:16-699(-)